MHVPLHCASTTAFLFLTCPVYLRRWAYHSNSGWSRNIFFNTLHLADFLFCPFKIVLVLQCEYLMATVKICCKKIIQNNALPFYRTRRIFKVLECVCFSATHRMNEKIKCIKHVQYIMSCLLMWPNRGLSIAGLRETRKGDDDCLKFSLVCEILLIYTPWFQGNISYFLCRK